MASNTILRLAERRLEVQIPPPNLKRTADEMDGKSTDKRLSEFIKRAALFQYETFSHHGGISCATPTVFRSLVARQWNLYGPELDSSCHTQTGRELTLEYKALSLDGKSPGQCIIAIQDFARMHPQTHVAIVRDKCRLVIAPEIIDRLVLLRNVTFTEGASRSLNPFEQLALMTRSNHFGRLWDSQFQDDFTPIALTRSEFDQLLSKILDPHGSYEEGSMPFFLKMARTLASLN